MPQSPDVADTAPEEPFLTGYDEQHLVIYLRLLDADAEVPIGARSRRRVWKSHLARAKWMTTSGFKHLLRDGAPH